MRTCIPYDPGLTQSLLPQQTWCWEDDHSLAPVSLLQLIFPLDSLSQWGVPCLVKQNQIHNQSLQWKQFIINNIIMHNCNG